MRQLAIDVGNTRVKSALWTDGIKSAWDGKPVDMALASVTGATPNWGKIMPGIHVELLTSERQLPIAIDYKTPTSLGADRKAAACGAWRIHQGKRGCVVIDAGTCVTIDWIDKNGTYRGGAILPGVEMKFKALNNFTAHLPLLHVADLKSELKCGFIGKSTIESIVAGVVEATKIEIKGFVEKYRQQDPQLKVIMTGGDAQLLCDNSEWCIEKDLVLIGLYEIMQHTPNI